MKKRKAEEEFTGPSVRELRIDRDGHYVRAANGTMILFPVPPERQEHDAP